MLHTDESTTCPITDGPTNYHFEARCEDCDAKRVCQLSLDRVECLYRAGRITQDEYEGYCLAWDLLSPIANAARVSVSKIPAVRRFARKLIRARGLGVPAVLIEDEGAQR